MKTITNILIFVFGKNQKTRFRRIIFTLLAAAFFFIMAFNVSCGFDSSGKFYFDWSNIDTTLEIKK